MSAKRFILAHAEARRGAIEAIKNAPEGYHVEIKEPTRSLDANAAMWATLSDISDQVEWYGKKLVPEVWKDIFSSALSKCEVVPNLEGTGYVAIGLRTSQMSIRQMSDLIELATAFGVNHDVKFKASKN